MKTSSPPIYFTGLLILLLNYTSIQAQDSFIYWFEHEDHSVLRGDLESSAVDTLARLQPRQPLAFDMVGEDLYWVNNLQSFNPGETISAIWKGDPHEANAEFLLAIDSVIVKLRVDHQNEWVYWLQREILHKNNTGIIRRMNINDGSSEDLSSEGEISSFAIDTVGQHLYWSEQKEGVIIRSRTDGTDKDTIVSGYLDVHDIEVDAVKNVLYWSGRPVEDDNNFGIFQASLDGEAISLLVEEPAAQYGISLAPDILNGDLYWTAEDSINSIKSIDPEEGNVNILLDNPRITGFELIFHPQNKRLYWLNAEASFFPQRRIVSIDTGGNDFREELVGFERPKNMAIDTMDEELFWTSLGDNALYSANFDGTNIRSVRYGTMALTRQEMRAVIVNRHSGLLYLTYGHPLNNPSTFGRLNKDGSDYRSFNISEYAARIFAFDPFAGIMYWAGESAPHGFFDSSAILRADESDPGGSTEILIDDNELPSHVSGIALDLEAGKLYWTESDSGKIRRANLNGTEIEDVLTDLDQPVGIMMDVDNGKMYWTERGNGKIRRANLNGTEAEDLFTDLTSPSRIAFTSESTGTPLSISPPDQLPEAFRVQQNYPNPFNPVTIIPFELPVNSHVHLEIYDLLGRRITLLTDQAYEAGRHEISWNANGEASGVYLVRVNITDNQGQLIQLNRQVMLLK